VNYYDGTVSVIATATNTVVATVPVGGEPDEVSITPDGSRAYVTNFDGDTVSHRGGHGDGGAQPRRSGHYAGR
jgi:YVTN family beta-propeller protein